MPMLISTILPRSARSIVTSFKAQSLKASVVPRQPHVDVGHHTFVYPVIMVADAPNRLLELEAFEFRKETNMPHVDAYDRHIGAMHQFRGTQNGSIAAQHHDDLGFGRNGLRQRAEIGNGVRVYQCDIEAATFELQQCVLHNGAGLTQFLMGHHNCMSYLGHLHLANALRIS